MGTVVAVAVASYILAPSPSLFNTSFDIAPSALVVATGIRW